MELTYHRKGDYLFPNLIIKEETVAIGKYGMLRKTFLKEHRKNWYHSMMLTGKLENHLAQTEKAAQERMEVLVHQMMEKQGVTEDLKARDQMAWVGVVNNIRNVAEEIVLKELVYI